MNSFIGFLFELKLIHRWMTSISIHVQTWIIESMGGYLSIHQLDSGRSHLVMSFVPVDPLNRI